MKTTKLKTYVVYVSPTFPAYHPRKGEPTLFAASIINALENRDSVNVLHHGETFVCKHKKIHTIRKNYEEWKRKETEINEGRAVLSIRQWNGTRYQKGATWTEIARLEKIGVQRLDLIDGIIHKPIIDETIDNHENSWLMAGNDGLHYCSFCDWFSRFEYDLDKPLAIIHFTDFRY